MGRHALWTAMLAAGLLAGCGGGGGDDAGPPAAANVTVNGTAAKGPMANATVTAHAVKADGTIDETPLATGETNASGAYTLSFDATQDQPVVIRVTAKAGTTHLDEVTGQSQPLPEGFSMRSVIVPATSGTVTTSASITPFSEMAVAAAQKAGGLTVANVDQAVVAMSDLLGFNPVSVQPAKAADAVGPEQQKLAVMLAAVSQMAADGALGCDTGDAAAKADCVVEALAASASATSLKLSGGTAQAPVDVSAQFASAVTAVLAKPAVVGPISAAVVTDVLDKLACESTACEAPVATPASGAIAAAKSLLSQIKTDIASVFVGGGTEVGSGPLNSQVLAFEAAMKNVQVPATMLVGDLSALIKGADLYNDFRAGRSGHTRLHAEGMTSSNLAVDAFPAIGCTVYEDAANTIVATSAATANYVGCRATYYLTGANGVRTTWRHGFTLTPAGDGSFGYAMAARKRNEQLTNGSWVNVPGSNVYADGQTKGYDGTLTAGTDSSGHIVSFSVKGELPGAYAQGGYAIVNDHHAWELSGTRTIEGFRQEISSLSGTLVAYSDASTVEGTLAVNSLKTREIPLTEDMTRPSASNPAVQGDIAEVEMDIVWTTAAAEFAGTFKATGSQWDKSATYHVPTSVSLSGSLRNLVEGQAAEFMAGTFTAKATGYENFDDTLPTSGTNYHGLDLSFVGSVTAPNRPKLELAVGASGKSYSDDLDTLTMKYRTLVNDTARTVVTLSHSVVDGKDVFKLTEASANLSLEWLQGAQTADLKRGDLVIGTFDQNAKNVTFTDKTHLSLDLGF